MVLNKAELINYMNENKGITKADAKNMLELVCDTFIDVLKEGNDFNVQGYFKMGVKERKGRNGKNPKTGEDIVIPTCNVPYCDFSKGIKEEVK